ncbi:MAG: hypothetical protein OXL37_06950 [Chloroflexota bacterium]|nr:hypothetical protein [Chloroflexota bacterium]MDE2960634.1 hypothetical protein [Chloroflexota bacterium]
MDKITEREMADSVQSVARGLGYEVEIEPSTRRWRWPSRNYLVPVAFGGVLRPDLVVRHKDHSAVVELKNRGVLFGGVEQVIQYAEEFKAAGVLCMPDDAIRETPASVAAYADAENIVICPISQIGEVLTDILGRPEYEALREVNA